MQIQLTSFTLGLPDLHVTHVTEAADGTALFWVNGTAAGAKCPKCQTWTERVHQCRRQPVNDLPAHGRAVLLVLTRRRWRCGSCDHVFPEVLPSVARYQRMTERFRQAVYRSLRGRTATAVADETGLGPGRLQRVFERCGDAEVAAHPAVHPTVLGVDEFAAKRGCVYNTVFVDLEQRKIADVVEGRRSEAVGAYLRSVADSVKVVVIDLSDPYRTTIRRTLPEAMIVADKFHVLRLAHTALNTVRLRVRKALKGDRSHATWRRRWILQKNYENLPKEQLAELRALLVLSTDLKKVYAAKECLGRWYRTCSAENALPRLDRLLQAWVRSVIPELRTMARTLRRWRIEISNYGQHRVSNGVTEGLNNRIKVTKRQAYGFRSFRNFRRKILLAG